MLFAYTAEVTWNSYLLSEILVSALILTEILRDVKTHQYLSHTHQIRSLLPPSQLTQNDKMSHV